MKEEMEIKLMPAGSSLKIKKSFSDWMPKNTAEDIDLLIKSIDKKGIIDPIDIWNEFIIDGHTRYNIAKNKGLPFKVRIHPLDEFKSISDVKEWMIEIQLGRRNLNPIQRNFFLGLLHEINEKKRGGDVKSEETKNQKPHNGVFDNTKSTTAKNIAKKQGVSKNTVQRGVQFYKIVEASKELFNKEVSDKIKNGDIKIPVKKYKTVKDLLEKKEVKSMDELLSKAGIQVYESKEKEKEFKKIEREKFHWFMEFESYLRKMGRLSENLRVDNPSDEDLIQLKLLSESFNVYLSNLEQEYLTINNK